MRSKSYTRNSYLIPPTASARCQIDTPTEFGAVFGEMFLVSSIAPERQTALLFAQVLENLATYGRNICIWHKFEDPQCTIPPMARPNISRPLAVTRGRPGAASSSARAGARACVDG